MVTKKENKTTPTKSKVIIDIEEANALVNWLPQKHKACSVCGKMETHYTVTASAGTVCRSCCEKAIENELKASQANQWDDRRIKEALSPQSKIIERLAVLTHMETLQHRMDLRPLLIENLGFISNHPFSRTVRQKAFNACASYHHKKAIYRSLAATKRYENWHHQVNVATLCFILFPDEISTIQKCREAASHKTIGARVHMTHVLCTHDEAWAQIIWKTLCLDVNPIVRKACQEIADEKGLKIPSYSPLKNTSGKGPSASAVPKKATSKKEKVVFSKFEKELSTAFNFQFGRTYQKIYSEFLKDLLNDIDSDIVGEKNFRQMNSTSHSGFIKLLAQVLSNKTLFEKMLKKLPAEVGLLLYLCTWEKGLFADKDMLNQLTRIDFEKMLDIAIPKAIHPMLGEPFSEKINWDVEVMQNSAFFLLKWQRTWKTHLSSSGYYFSIHPVLKEHLKQLLPLPDDYHIVPIKTVDTHHLQHHDSSGLFETIPAIMAFINQDQLEFTKNGNKIKVNSLNKMMTLCRIDEFYQKGPSLQRCMKTNLLANFFISGTSWDENESDDIPGSLKKRIQDYLSFEGYRTFRSRDLMTHVKLQQEEYDDDEDEASIRSSFQAVLKLISQEKWVSMENLSKTVKYKNFDFWPFTHQAECQRLRAK